MYSYNFRYEKIKQSGIDPRACDFNPKDASKLFSEELLCEKN